MAMAAVAREAAHQQRRRGRRDGGQTRQLAFAWAA
jgi:hypothetical protein